MTEDERIQPLDLRPRDGLPHHRHRELRRRGLREPAAAHRPVLPADARAGHRPGVRVLRRRARRRGPAAGRPPRHRSRPPPLRLRARGAGGDARQPEAVAFMASLLPAGATWSATGIGRTHLPVTLAAIALGGHVRTGFEDTIYYRKGELAASNAQLIERVARLAEESGAAWRPPGDPGVSRAGGSETDERAGADRRKPADRPGPGSGFPEGLADAPPTTSGQRRDECRAEAEYLSYFRRLIQVRQDILAAERDRRRPASDARSWTAWPRSWPSPARGGRRAGARTCPSRSPTRRSSSPAAAPRSWSPTRSCRTWRPSRRGPRPRRSTA